MVSLWLCMKVDMWNVSVRGPRIQLLRAERMELPFWRVFGVGEERASSMKGFLGSMFSQRC